MVPKPSLRGLSHQIGAVAALVAAVFLLALAPSSRAVVAGLIYVTSLIAQLSISGAYHRGAWGPIAETVMQRLDHSAVFLLIAGTYTPFCMLALDPAAGSSLLVVAWVIAALGILRAALWVDAPRWVVAGGYLFFGWCALPWFPQVLLAVDGVNIGLMFVGGIVYSVGALIYWRKWPNPNPLVFGYHEVFHVFVIVANACFFTAVYRLIYATA